MSTILDVARLAGVSRTTVSRVLNNSHLVNREMRKRVLKTIRELNYRPSFLAQGMRLKRTNSFAILIPDFTNLYYSELVNYIEVEARKRGYLAIACTTEVDHEREREYVGQLLRRHIDGLIFCWYRGVNEEKSYLEELARRVSVVLLDQPAEGLPITSIYTDGHGGMRKITNYLIGKGHRKFAYIRGPIFCPAIQDRYRGFAAALAEHGLELESDLLGEGDFTIEGGYRAARRLLGRKKPTAVVTDDDLAAIGVLECCREKRLKVPEDLAVTGFDNILISAHITPMLTTVAQPIREIAEAATSELVSRIENKAAEGRTIVFPPRLVIRESSG